MRKTLALLVIFTMLAATAYAANIKSKNRYGTGATQTWDIVTTVLNAVGNANDSDTWINATCQSYKLSVTVGNFPAATATSMIMNVVEIDSEDNETTIAPTNNTISLPGTSSYVWTHPAERGYANFTITNGVVSDLVLEGSGCK